MSSSHAATYYWDTNGTAASLGDTAGTWGSSVLFRTIGNPEARGVIDGTLSTFASQSGAALGGDIFYFGTVNLALGSTASTIGINGTGVTAGHINFGAGQGSQGVTLSSGGGAITMLNTGTAAPIIVSNNTGTNTIGAVLSGSNGLAVYGPGTLLLTGANSFTGGSNGLIVRNGATLQVGNGTSGSLTSQNLTFNNGGGIFNVRAVDTGSTQAMGALTFTTGDGTVQSTYGSSGNAELTFSSLAARGVSATGNFVVSGGSNGTTNKIVLSSGAVTGFLDKGLFFGGSNYAAYDATGYVRGLAYGTDTNAAATDTITASNHVQLTSSVSGRTGDTLLSLNLSGGGVNYTAISGSLNVPGILKSGGGALSTISGGTSLTTTSNAELVIRTDTSADLLEISTNITGFNTGLTKTGAGTLTLSGTNGYTGTTRVNAGTLVLSGGTAILDTQNVSIANTAGATLQLNTSETFNNLTGGGFSGGTVNVQGNTLTLASGTSHQYDGTFTGTSSGGIIKQGATTLTLSNKNTFAGTITVSAGTLSFAYGNDATSNELALSSGGAISLNSTTTLNFAPGSNTLVGTVGSQLQVGKGWTIGNDINVAAGTANITFGSSNDSRWTFNGGISGSSTPATATTLAITTASSSGDRQMATFAGVIQDGSGGALGLNITTRAASAGAFVNLANSNTFTGAIAMATTTAQPGYLVIGGVRNSGGLTTGTGSLGSGGVYNNTISLTQSSTGAPILNYASSANQTLGGEISGTNGQLWKDGAGTLTLSVANSYTGVTTVNSGTLLVNGSLNVASAVTVTAGTLGGTGTINGTVTIGNSSGSADAILAPGASSIDSLDTGNLTFNSDGRYAVELNGTSVTCDVTNVTGSVSLHASTTLVVDLTGTLSASQQYLIVANDAADVVSGTFSGLIQGAVVGTFGGTELKISYTGGDGNDIVLYTEGSGSPYSTWAGSAAFTDDANGDGVDNGLAWFLGADNPTVSALDKLPVASTPTGFLQLDFTRKNPSAPAKLYLEYGNDLSGWTKLEIPAATGTIGGDIEVTVTAGPPDAIKIKIPTATHAVAGKLFARLSATEN
jgi:autotransporter-associated beta strand protein